MKLVIDVYEYGRGGKCVYIFKYTYAAIRIISMQIVKKDRHMSRVMRITEHHAKDMYSICRKRRERTKRWS